MFSSNKKIFYIFALISGVAGIIVLGLKVFGVFPDDTLYTLIALVLLLLAFALYLRPSIKVMRNLQAAIQSCRNDFYQELTKKGNFIESASFYENAEHQLQFDNYIFSSLSFDEALVVMESLMKEYVMIIYGLMDEKSKKIIKAKIESFSFDVTKSDGTIAKKDLIKNYLFIK